MVADRRLVVVSNRVPPPPAGDGPWPAGGLVSALLPALLNRGNALWFGWTGETGEPFGTPHSARADGVQFVTLDLSERQVDQYYDGFCNRVLWPAMHGVGDDRRDPSTFGTYRSVNRGFAASLLPLLRADDLVWIHDYHLMPLGQDLRRAGWSGPLGYFHHTPIPDRGGWLTIPFAELLADGLRSYDLIGVQTSRDARRLHSILGTRREHRIGVYPAGIDPNRFRELARVYRANPLHRARDDRQVMVGVDRLDYTKGILERLQAFGRLLLQDPTIAERVRFVQWAAPSREDVPEYQAYRRQVEAAAHRINERFAGLKPVQLEIAPHSPDEVASALLHADICLVTSVADGMNLVAKEFSAVHSTAAPGVLILSDACGASEQLADALIVQSNDVRSITDAMSRAIDMPVDERAARSRRLRANVDTFTTQDWLARFEEDLAQAGHHDLPARTRQLVAS
jgi:trehalose 6-phosphate synthase